MMRRIFSALIAFSFMFGPVVGWTIGVQPVAIDNRPVAPAPSTVEGWDSFDALGPWAADRVPWRAESIRLKAWLDFHVLRELPAPRTKDSPGTHRTSVAPPVVRGDDGYLFYGRDFSIACNRTATFEKALKSFQRLAEIIETSGRKVVFTVAPNKSAVLTDHLPRTVPHGACASRGIAEQNAVLDRFRHPLWVDLRSRLVEAEANGQQPYWRTDTHWTTGGGAIFAHAVADHLDPMLARRIRQHPEKLTKVGDLNLSLGLNSKESPRSVAVSTGATVRADPTLAQYDPTRLLKGTERWTSRPAAGLIPADTLILGDSFSYVALGNLRPLFANGTYMWLVHPPDHEVIAAIKAAETVVLQIVQRNVDPGQHYLRPEFTAKVAAALGVPAR